MATTSTPVRDGFLRVLGAVTTPLVPSDYLDVIDPLRSGAALRGRIQAITAETADAATVLIRPGRGWQGHLPGQYVRIGIDVEGVRLWRAYSLTSGPRRDGLIAITVKAIPDGRVSNHIVRRARPGTVIQLDQATGDFHLPSSAPPQVLFVTAGSGVTPVMGMLRHRLPELADVVVVHSAPTPHDVIFAAELRDMASAGRIRLVERHTDTDGMLDPSELDDLVPDWSVREAWACGPTGLLDALEERWAAAGVTARLHTERFRPHIVVTGEGGAVSFARSGTVVEADGATPLLDAGEAAGVLMPSGCRMGICMGCVVPLESGAVRDLRSGALTTAVPGDGVKIQTCISAAAGPCSLDL
jgi:ferredoxin-NADP reductase